MKLREEYRSFISLTDVFHIPVNLAVGISDIIFRNDGGLTQQSYIKVLESQIENGRFSKRYEDDEVSIGFFSYEIVLAVASIPCPTSFAMKLYLT